MFYIWIYSFFCIYIKQRNGKWIAQSNTTLNYLYDLKLYFTSPKSCNNLLGWES